MSAPKVGDRVRATGAFTGTVARVSDDFLTLHGDDSVQRTLSRELWTLEVIEPPEPPWATRVNAVVLDRVERAWQFRDDYWGRGLAAYAYADLLRVFGPLTLIYDPEATS